MRKRTSSGSLKKQKPIPKSNPFDYRKPNQKFAPSNTQAKRQNVIKASEKSIEKVLSILLVLAFIYLTPILEKCYSLS